MKFACPHCQQSLEADDSFAGASVDCPTCGQPLAIPQPPAAEPPRKTAVWPSPSPDAPPKSGVRPRPAPAGVDADRPKSKKKLFLVFGILLFAAALLFGFAKVAGKKRPSVADKDAFRAKVASLASENLAAFRHETRWDGDTLVINLWHEYAALGALMASAGFGQVSDAWNTARRGFVELSATLAKTAKDNGFEGHAIVNLLDINDHDACLLSVCDGVVVYDATLK